MYDELLKDDAAPIQQEGLMDTIKDYLNPSKLVEKLDLSKQKMVGMAIYFVVGLVIGFLVKKYANFLIAAAITIGGIAILSYCGFVDVTVHTDRINGLFGITMPSIQGDLCYHIGEWVKGNIAVVASLVVGFLIGLKFV